MTSLSESLLGGRRQDGAPTEQARPKKVHSRLTSLDLFRGFIICIMAWDHTCHPFLGKEDSTKHPGFEVWEGPYATYDNEPRKFLARVVSHICAPGFFITMGMSMVFFTASRRLKLSWSWHRVFRHHFVRGCVLLGVEYVKDLSSALPKLADIWNGREVTDWRGNTFRKGDTGKVIYESMFSINEVMTSLGFTMMLSQLAMPLFFYADQKKPGSAVFLGLALFCMAFAASNIAIVLAQNAAEDVLDPPVEFPHLPGEVHNAWQLVARILFYPGQLFSSWEVLLDPVFPWIGVVFLGMGLGFPLRANANRAYKLMAVMGLVFLVCFALVRGFGGSMNYRGAQRGEESIASSLMQFFIQTKYPPDWAFALITLGVDLLIIYVFSAPLFNSVEPCEEENDAEAQQALAGEESKAKKWFLRAVYPFLVFGRTPMFFYLCHFWVICTLNMFFRLPSSPSGRFAFFPGIFLVWATVLIIMYPLCTRYLAFKSRTDPESLWRLF